MNEAAEELDTNYNRVASIVVYKTATIGKAMEELSTRVREKLDDIIFEME